MNTLKCLIISDFNTTNLHSLLLNDASLPKLEPAMVPFGQVIQVLTKPESEVWSEKFDAALIWTQPGEVIESFQRALNFETVTLDQLLYEVDAFVKSILALKEKVRIILIVSWSIAPYLRGYGLQDLRNGLGIANTLMRMNLRLADDLSNEKDIYILNGQRWIDLGGEVGCNPKLWYMAKIPFSIRVFKEAANDIKAALRAFGGRTKKLIITDLDETLWGGIVGEIGWQGLNLGGHDAIGEAFVDFQKSLRSLTRRGILLAIVSKNEESIAIEAIKRHPDMILKLDDFANWRVNWNDKAQNIIEIVSELNLGLDSVVFIDDNPVERARIAQALPEVYVPEWPQNKMLYKKTLLSLPCFDATFLSTEDAQRLTFYREEKNRNLNRMKAASFDDWLKSICLKVKVEELSEVNIKRAVQLLNKTNQMNLTTRRMSESELLSWLARDRRLLWTFRVADKYGDSGLTGTLSLEIINKQAKIIDFVLSCRVMGRKVEEAMLYIAIEHARRLKLDEVIAEYGPTDKNKPCLDFLNRSCCHQTDNYIFSWPLSEHFEKPEGVDIEIAPLSNTK